MYDELTLIFANGEPPDREWAVRQAARAGRIIAADGGLAHIQSLGLTPALLIGDLDSVAPEQLRWAEEHGAELRRFPVHKDETDLELALLAAAETSPRQVIITAAFGGRLDQTLANIFLLNLPVLASLDVRVDDGRQELLLVQDSIELAGEPGDRVSLLPLSPVVTGITTTGLEYPLVDETLSFNHSRGVSNRMLTDKADISLASGILICIHERKDYSK